MTPLFPPLEPGPQTVLVVDDIAINRFFACSVLESLCTVVPAADGPQALQLALVLQPDLILLDVQMPGMSGFEVCRRLKANPQTASIAVIFITALNESHSEEQGLDLGAIDYITKPFRAPTLRARVRNHLELSRQRKQLERLGQVDGLTGLANRRYFDHELAQAWALMARLAQPLALLMIDVDCFKAYNDHYGHLAGDQCLQQVARAIAATAQRPGDCAARYGGEEFACVLAHTDLAGALQVGGVMRQAIEALRLEHPQAPHSHCVTVSVGVASAVPGPGTDARTLLAAADAHLYAAKRQGRNRVAGAASAPATGSAHQSA